MMPFVASPAPAAASAVSAVSAAVIEDPTPVTPSFSILEAELEEDDDEDDKEDDKDDDDEEDDKEAPSGSLNLLRLFFERLDSICWGLMPMAAARLLASRTVSSRCWSAWMPLKSCEARAWSACCLR